MKNKMYPIIVIWNNGMIEEVDRFTNKSEALEALTEYQIAFDPHISSIRIDEDVF